jgi:biopolymer transport protein ExbD
MRYDLGVTNRLVILLALLACACGGSRGEPATSPAPPLAGAPAPAPTEAKPPTSASCELRVTIANHRLAFAGPVTASAAKDADLHGTLAKVDRTCRVVLVVNDMASYLEMDAALAQLKTAGFSRFAVSEASNDWLLGPEDTISNRLVVTVSKLDVLVDGRSIGKEPGAPDLAAAVKAALEAIKRGHEDTTIMIRNDDDTSPTTIDKLVIGARDAGFRRVVFDATRK